MTTNIKQKVVQSFKVLLEMLEDRKELEAQEMEYLKGFGKNEISALATNNAIFTIDVGKRLRIIYYLLKFKMADFKSYIETAEFEQYILIVTDKLTTNNIKSISEFEKKNETQINIQYFDLDETLFNITKHVLVPKHEVITDEKTISELVERYNIKSKLQFPIILKTDPVARYFGVKPGNLVKITRDSPSAGEYIVYRCCV